MNQPSTAPEGQQGQQAQKGETVSFRQGMTRVQQVAEGEATYLLQTIRELEKVAFPAHVDRRSVVEHLQVAAGAMREARARIARSIAAMDAPAPPEAAQAGQST